MVNELECIVESDIIPITEETPYTNELTPAIEELPAESSEFRNMRPEGMDAVMHEIYSSWAAFTNGFNELIWETNLLSRSPTCWSFDREIQKAQRERIDSICRQRYPHGGYTMEYVLGRAASAAADLVVGTGILLFSYYGFQGASGAAVMSFIGLHFTKGLALNLYVDYTGYEFYMAPAKQLPEKGQCLLESI